MQWQDTDILEVKPLSNTIIQVLLKPKQYTDYRAGQYLQIKTIHFENYFSIANAPIGNSFYECHIRHDTLNPSSQELLQHIQEYRHLKIRLPFGRCYLEQLDSSKPIIFIAGGTGFAPIKSMIEMMLFQNDARSFECYWGAKTQSDLYWQEQLHQYQNHTPLFKHLACVIDDDLLKQVLEHHPNDLNAYQFVLSGPFEMVFKYRDRLLSAGVKLEFMHADAFEFKT